MRWSTRSLLWPGLILLAAVVWLLIHMFVGSVQFDFSAVGVAALIMAFAAIWGTWIKAKEAVDLAEEVDDKVNGGLRKAAREHMQDNEIIIGLTHRLDRADQDRDDCHEDLADLRQFVIDRFDENGLGRTTDTPIDKERRTE